MIQPSDLKPIMRACSTCVMGDERAEALAWRAMWLDAGDCKPPNLDPQIVAYLIEDHETLRSVYRMLASAYAAGAVDPVGELAERQPTTREGESS